MRDIFEVVVRAVSPPVRACVHANMYTIYIRCIEHVFTHSVRSERAMWRNVIVGKVHVSQPASVHTSAGAKMSNCMVVHTGKTPW